MRKKLLVAACALALALAVALLWPTAGYDQVVFSDDTRRMLITIIEAHRTAADDSHMALVALRGSPRDYARLVWKTAANF